jgi:hypothetical protein
MKKIKFLLLALVAIFTLSLTSCKKDNLRLSGDCEICGNWTLDSVNGGSDGTPIIFTESQYKELVAPYQILDISKLTKDSVIIEDIANDITYRFNISKISDGASTHLILNGKTQRGMITNTSVWKLTNR